MSGYTIPNVVEKRPTGERALDIYSRLLSDRIVYLGTELDDGVANVIVAQLLHLESEDADREINLYLNSPGGSMTAMLAIYDTMQFIHAPVATTCVGQAASAAAVLLSAGSPGRRAILPHGRVLLHQPSAEGRGTLPDLVLHAREIMRIRAQMEEVLSRHTGQSAGAAAGRHRPGQDLHGRGRRRVRDRGRRDHQSQGVGGLSELSSTGLWWSGRRRQAGLAGQAARATGPVGRPAVLTSRCPTARVRSTSGRSRAPPTAASISDEGSLRPRSISERYCTEMPARSATARWVSPRSVRRARSTWPTSSRHKGSRDGRSGSGTGRRGNATTSPMR